MARLVPQEMLDFAHELYETQNWRGAFPLHLATVYDQLVADMPDPRPALADPQVWRDVQKAYLPYLKVFDDPSPRSVYCYRACRCGQWDVDRQQFDLLGDQAMPEHFGGNGDEARSGPRQNSSGKGSRNAVMRDMHAGNASRRR